MSEEVYQCFIGGLAWATSDKDLREAFEKYGHLLESKVAVDKFSGRSRGYGFVTFDEKQAMEEAIDKMNGMELDGRTITVDKAQPRRGSARDGDGNHERGRDRDHDRSRGYGSGRGSGGGDCFRCGKPGHFARECPSEAGDRYGDRNDRYGDRNDRHGDKNDRYGDKNDRYGDRNDRYGGGSRHGPDRNGDRYGGRSRNGGSRGDSGSDRYHRDRSGPYERRGTGGFRSG